VPRHGRPSEWRQNRRNRICSSRSWCHRHPRAAIIASKVHASWFYYSLEVCPAPALNQIVQKRGKYTVFDIETQHYNTMEQPQTVQSPPSLFPAFLPLKPPSLYIFIYLVAQPLEDGRNTFPGLRRRGNDIPLLCYRPCPPFTYFLCLKEGNMGLKHDWRVILTHGK